MNRDAHFMSLALDLAAKGRFTVSPNPMVGCIIVNHDEIVGSGYHQIAGGPHAEIIALREAGERAKDATVYVTLEPCCHFNRTPPCTKELIAAQVKKIVIASIDPNPKVSGKGINELISAGIAVETGLLQAEAEKLNEIFFHYITHQRPFVISKWAMSLDGKTVTHIDDDKHISCAASRMHSHQLRQQVDAILIGSTTAIVDNPSLTIRLENNFRHKQPVRIILSSGRQLPSHLKLLTDHAAKTIIASTSHHATNVANHLSSQLEILTIPENKHYQVDLLSLLHELGKREISSILVEGGMRVHHSFFAANLVNRIHVYLAPTLIGNLQHKQFLQDVHLVSIENDYLLTADLGENHV